MFERFKHKDTKNKSELLLYQAFDSKDRSRRLRIRRAKESAHTPDYRYWGLKSSGTKTYAKQNY
ncbi:hypothetical protein AADEFJLK_04679 [Methylovulum psychrotolerans]|uniref:Uncharacterized protein n=1 Tax=Methylovulum psychrotolerans TaxID=1704499 RepID=A0A2S5CFH6_9GAMM|nr:hypothetical protein AADEFJLK_04679 [Methylovulum psychrotolerans]